MFYNNDTLSFESASWTSCILFYNSSHTVIDLCKLLDDVHDTTVDISSLMSACLTSYTVPQR